jgi:hypothetical protein
MADGRHFTDHRPRCDVNYIFPRDKSVNSYDYRMFLVHNTDHLIRSSRDATYAQNVCGPCKDPYNVGTMLPEASKVVCDAQSCRVVEHDPAGLGQGRQYAEAFAQPAESAFLKHKQQETDVFSKYANCCAPQEDVLNYHSIDAASAAKTAAASRSAVPSGGKPFA